MPAPAPGPAPAAEPPSAPRPWRRSGRVAAADEEYVGWVKGLGDQAPDQAADPAEAQGDAGGGGTGDGRADDGGRAGGFRRLRRRAVGSGRHKAE